jgi:hypothetical protein
LLGLLVQPVFEALRVRQALLAPRAQRAFPALWVQPDYAVLRAPLVSMGRLAQLALPGRQAYAALPA